MPSRVFYSFIGIFIGLWVPVNWLLWRAFSSRRAWWMSWLKSEFGKNDAVYLVLAVCACCGFALLGYWLGSRKDDLEEEKRSISDLNEELHELATTDGLTGLFNARYIHKRLDEELENSYQSPLSCLLVDIDHFKRINDKFGHPFGDQVLTNIARILKNAVRRLDVAGRLGGEEFILVLPNTPANRALEVAERVRAAVQGTPFEYKNKRVEMTVSVGVSTHTPQLFHTKETLLQAADEGLYAAKRAGRNRVVAWKAAEEQKFLKRSRSGETF